MFYNSIYCNLNLSDSNLSYPLLITVLDTNICIEANRIGPYTDSRGGAERVTL